MATQPLTPAAPSRAERVGEVVPVFKHEGIVPFTSDKSTPRPTHCCRMAKSSVLHATPVEDLIGLGLAGSKLVEEDYLPAAEPANALGCTDTETMCVDIPP